ncbi:MAG: tetratricopeptide repeat protein [Phycisphaerae bacterium]|jgi:tetratricopeptide (TPR) repeat protein|nr:tetratricopeptide repeat protein [Phycisphaerae bacterium]
MTREFTQAEIDKHDALVERADKLCQGMLLIHDSYPPNRLGWFGRRKLRKAILCFEEALRMNPQAWASMWRLGKIHQRLGDHSTSLRWFSRAHKVNPTQPDVAREAGLAALDCGQAKAALKFCQAAVDNSPDDAGLVCNLALAHMLCGDDQAALQCVTRAVEADPNDKVSANVRKLVCDVRDGKRRRPRSLGDAFPN